MTAGSRSQLQPTSNNDHYCVHDRRNKTLLHEQVDLGSQVKPELRHYCTCNCSKMNMEMKDLGEGVQAIVLRDGVFPFGNDPTNVLFVRKCIRDIADAIIKYRKKRKNGTTAIVGQPGIGKSHNLFYFALRFLEEEDVEAVILESSETGMFHFFYDSTHNQDDLPAELCQGETPLSSAPSNIQMVFDLLLSRDEVVYIVDLDVEKSPAILLRNRGFTVYSSSNRPYQARIKGKRQHKMMTKLFSPPPWPREQIKVVFDYASESAANGGKLGIQAWAEEVKRPFEDYFNVFGGTLRPLQDPEEEMNRMVEGAEKMGATPPDQMWDLVAKGTETMGDDFTHALFSEEGGAEKEDCRVRKLPTRRQFRSSFTSFWFRKHIAPRILFKHYRADCLKALYHTTQSADRGK